MKISGKRIVAVRVSLALGIAACAVVNNLACSYSAAAAAFGSHDLPGATAKATRALAGFADAAVYRVSDQPIDVVP